MITAIVPSDVPWDTPREREFRRLVRGVLTTEHRVPGPTELSEAMGLGRKNWLSGRYSKIRIQELESAGYVKIDGRWRHRAG